MNKIVIGIVGNLLIMEGGMFPGLERDYVNRDYGESISLAGAVPVVLTVQEEDEAIRAQLERVDAIVLSGGYDITTQLYGEEPMWEQGFVYPKVDQFYMKTIKIARKLGKPILGICKGIQAVNVALGGSLYQDINRQVQGSMKHSQSSPRQYGTHRIKIEKDSFLGECLAEEVLVNSFHHQSVKQLGAGLRITARASDGVIEGIESTEGSFVTAVQWHPEMMASHGDKEMIGLFKHFVEKVERGIQ
ncbi:para-aminobenzoate synthase, amidotransferase component [Lachnospiraceae bacterium KM106-2]|nr:para-aminobenzoate synthase, amidotransferase component [Lachnospiraceae bacterium KM106-2]